MMASNDDHSAARLAQLLRAKREEVIRAWTARVRDDPKIPQSERLSEPELRDEVPALLDRLAESLDRTEHATASGESVGRTAGHGAESIRHAEHRIHERYDLVAALRELSHLRVAIMELFSREAVLPDLDALTTIHSAVDEALQTLAVTIAESTRTRLREQELQFHALADHISQLAWMAEPDGSIFWFNRRWFQFTGTTLESVRGWGWTHTHHPEHRRRAIEKFRAHIEAGIEWEDTFPLRGADGEYRWFLSRAIPIRDRDGHVTRWFGTNTDVTERIRVEQALQRAIAARDESLALLDTFMSSAPAAFAVIDRETRYVKVNETFAAMNGLPAAQHVGRTLREVFPALPEFAIDRVRSVFETGEPVLGLERSMATPAHPDERRHFLASLHPIRRSHAAVEAVGIIVVDVTDQKNTEVRLREDAALRERFIGILSHDIRNPIAAILITASTMLDSSHFDEAAVQNLRRIAGSAARMERMVRDLLDLTRTRHGGEIPMQCRPTDLDAISREAIDEVAASEGTDRIRLETVGDCTGHWDPDRLAQVVGNLVSNALHYSPAGTPVLVRVNGADAATVRLSVNNQGAPIPEEAQTTLFDPYRRGAERASPREGLGLGLFICEQIARAHHGAIDVRSALEGGTTFTVTLPRGSS